MAKGRIIDWKSDRGFGFVRSRDGGHDVFLHISDIRHAGYEPRLGDEVSFSLKRDARGRPRAAKAVIAGIPRTSPNWVDVVALLIPAGFLFNLFILGDFRPALFVYLGMSIVTIFAYAIDKQRAVTGAWRISEATLQLLGFLGGWPGAIPAQILFRHKTRKSSFQIGFWAIVAGHVGFWTWLSVTGLSTDELVENAMAIANSIKQ